MQTSVGVYPHPQDGYVMLTIGAEAHRVEPYVALKIAAVLLDEAETNTAGQFDITLPMGVSMTIGEHNARQLAVSFAGAADTVLTALE